MDLIHRGFDALEIAYQGRVAAWARSKMLRAKEAALHDGEAVALTLGGVSGFVLPRGTRAEQGYAYIWDTGPDGCTWTIKESDDQEQWNLRVTVRSAWLATAGLDAVLDGLSGHLKAMAAQVLSESVGRVDYAIDFVAPGFVLDPEMVVAHNRCTVSPHAVDEPPEDPFRPVRRGRRWESVTVGRMPNRQVTIYDKRREVLMRDKPHWPVIWGVEWDDIPPIWRVELRAGKEHLKDWNITTVADLKDKMGDMFLAAVQSVRYLDREPRPAENITRVPVGVIWRAVREVLKESLLDYASGVQRGRIRVERRATVEAQYFAQARGLVVGWAVARGLTPDRISEAGSDFSDQLAAWLKEPGNVMPRWSRVERRLVFMDGGSPNAASG